MLKQKSYLFDDFSKGTQIICYGIESTRSFSYNQQVLKEQPLLLILSTLPILSTSIKDQKKSGVGYCHCGLSV